MPVITTTTIPSTLIPETIKKDAGLKTVITQITKSSTVYQTATTTSVEVQVFNENITQYNVLLEVNGKKEQFVSIFNKTTNAATTITVTQVPTDIKPILHTQTKIDSQ